MNPRHVPFFNSVLCKQYAIYNCFYLHCYHHLFSGKRNSTTDFRHSTQQCLGSRTHTCQYFCRPEEKCYLAGKPILSNRTPWQRAGTLDISNTAISASWIDWGRLALEAATGCGCNSFNVKIPRLSLLSTSNYTPEFEKYNILHIYTQI